MVLQGPRCCCRGLRVDLIPDFIPVLGYLDDLIIVPLDVALVVRLIPPEVMKEYRTPGYRLSEHTSKSCRSDSYRAGLDRRSWTRWMARLSSLGLSTHRIESESLGIYLAHSRAGVSGAPVAATRE
jgi:hypothetical protein